MLARFVKRVRLSRTSSPSTVTAPRSLIGSAQVLAAAALLALPGALALPATAEAQTTTLFGNLDEGDYVASETVTPKALSGGICDRTEAVRDAIVARMDPVRP